MFTLHSLVISPNDPTVYTIVNMYTASSGRTVCQLARPEASAYPVKQCYADTLTAPKTAQQLDSDNARLIARLTAIEGVEYLGTFNATDIL